MILERLEGGGGAAPPSLSGLGARLGGVVHLPLAWMKVNAKWRTLTFLFLCFSAFPASLLFCFSCFFASLLFCFSVFPVSLLLCFSAFFLLCLLQILDFHVRCILHSIYIPEYHMTNLLLKTSNVTCEKRCLHSALGGGAAPSPQSPPPAFFKFKLKPKLH